MGMKDENEIIRLVCAKCKKSIEGTYKELFGGIPSLMSLPKFICKCGGGIELDMTGKYKIVSPTRSFEHDMAYPQYASKYRSHVITTTTWNQLQNLVLELKNDHFCGAHAPVIKHWNDILAGIIPFDMRIVKEEQNEKEKA